MARKHSTPLRWAKRGRPGMGACISCIRCAKQSCIGRPASQTSQHDGWLGSTANCLTHPPQAAPRSELSHFVQACVSSPMPSPQSDPPSTTNASHITLYATTNCRSNSGDVCPALYGSGRGATHCVWRHGKAGRSSMPSPTPHAPRKWLHLQRSGEVHAFDVRVRCEITRTLC